MRPRLDARHLIAALFVCRIAFAMPAPTVRPLPPAAAAASRASVAPADALRGACGTSIGDLGAVLAASAARPAVATLPTSHSTDTGDIAVLEDDGTFFYDNKDNRALVDIAAVGRAFYRTHGDDYDVLAVYLASNLTKWLGSPGALAAAWVLRNDTQGIGLRPSTWATSWAAPRGCRRCSR